MGTGASPRGVGPTLTLTMMGRLSLISHGAYLSIRRQGARKERRGKGSRAACYLSLIPDSRLKLIIRPKDVYCRRRDESKGFV